MLKVLIADDEKKVCRLIQMLCDWEKLEMELVGTAYNGLQAFEMIKELHPDILITDICMPGCDGVEIIKRVREEAIPLEILIISGYADFKYAQSAIHYGVSEYLLKPLKQQELQDTLQRMGAKCRQEKLRKDAGNKLLQYVEDDTARKRTELILDLLLNQKGRSIPELETLNERYLYHFVPGLFRVLALKLDYNPDKYDEQAIRSILNDLGEKIYPGLSECCADVELCTEGDTCYIVCNYTDDGSLKFRQAVRHALDQIIAKRFQLWNAVFSIGMGYAVKDCSRLDESFRTAQNALKERLLEGCERLLEPPNITGKNDYSDYIAEFNYQYARALEFNDKTLIHSCVEEFQEQLLKMDGISGSDLLNVVDAAGVQAITFTQKDEGGETISRFKRYCGSCSSAAKLFSLLESMLCDLIDLSRKQSEEKERKPIRVAKQYIQNHYMDPITLELVAETAGFNSSYFSSLFKKETGIGFSDYLIQIRMEKAKELLRNSKLNVRDICTQVGYSDLKHFTAMFRKYSGLKPGEFRKLYR